MSGRLVRVYSSAVISSAWAWWPIMPCMNFTSASVCWKAAGLTAAPGAATWLPSPGAPGRTTAGPDAGADAAVLAAHDVNAVATRTSAVISIEVFTSLSRAAAAAP